MGSSSPRCFFLLLLLVCLPFCTWGFVTNNQAAFLVPGLHAAQSQRFRASFPARRKLAAAAAAAATGAAAAATGAAAAAATGAAAAAAAAAATARAAAATGAAAAAASDAADEGVLLWSLSDLPAAEEALLRTAVRAADKHKIEDVVCLVRCSGWNTTEEIIEQERLLLHKRRGPLLSGHALPVPAEACLQPIHMKGVLKQRRKRQKEDLLKYDWEMMLIATGLSPTHLDSVAETVIDEISRTHGSSIYLGRDGRGTSGWVALNFGKLQMHFMTPITRKKYTLEILHKNAPRIDLKEILKTQDSSDDFIKP